MCGSQKEVDRSKQEMTFLAPMNKKPDHSTVSLTKQKLLQEISKSLGSRACGSSQFQSQAADTSSGQENITRYQTEA